MVVSSELQNPDTLPRGEKPSTFRIGNWVRPMASMSREEENAFYF